MAVPPARLPMKLTTGLNPYGLTHTLGLEARGTKRANPAGSGLEGFVAIATEIGARTLEIWDGWLTPLDEAGLAALKRRLGDLGMRPVVSCGLQHGDIGALLRAAEGLDAPHIRLALTSVLCGDRAALGDGWPALVAAVEAKLRDWAERAAGAGRVLLIENHQDFTSAELAALCEAMGPAVRIVYDTGNSFPVGEAPLDFTRRIAPYVRHLHLKDYRVQWTDEGLRLVRCAIGEGAVPFAEIFDLLGAHHEALSAVIEPGALTARHVRLLTPGWWRHYPPRAAEALAACLAAARRNRLPDDADWRTPWERDEDGAVSAYEQGQVARSAAALRAMGMM